MKPSSSPLVGRMPRANSSPVAGRKSMPRSCTPLPRPVTTTLLSICSGASVSNRASTVPAVPSSAYAALNSRRSSSPSTAIARTA
jgi:hypothetical protein